MAASRTAPKEIFADAAEFPSGGREAFLARACDGDARLLAEVRELLLIHDAAGALLDDHADGSSESSHAVPHVPEVAGSTIGRYRLIELIGEGGFGSVFMAEQERPVRRRVALKILKLGMDTRSVVARFEHERQALALMDHPGIAKVFDAGATEAGRPYFVMELVNGEPITEHCAAHRLSIRERLGLFVQVCRAVQHAHTKGIIHRDLKPGNVLVSSIDGGAVPRIIDFGIAKATGGHAGETLATESGLLVGTPEYMSPEQAQSPGVDIDTRTDIYSLGVLLYELLTGITPLDARALRSVPWDQMMRMIRESEPPRPSTRVAREPPAEREALPAVLRGDLDWITMRCLEKDRDRRYQTAEALAADIERHLAGQPVLAAPPSRWYRLRKGIARHRVPVATGVLVLVSLLAGLSAAIWQARIAARERDEAEQRRRETDIVAGFQADQLRAIDPHLMGGRLRQDLLESQRAVLERSGVAGAEASSRQAQLAALLADVNLTDVSRRALDRNIFSQAIGAIDQRFADQPGVRATLLLTAASTMAELGLLEQAEAPLQRALEIRRAAFGDDDPATIRAMAEYGALAIRRGQLDEAQRRLAEALERAQRVLGADDRLTIGVVVDLGSVRRDQDRLIEAERLFRDALGRAERALGPGDPLTPRILVDLGITLPGLRKTAEAEQCLRRAYEQFLKVRGPEATDTICTLDNLANCLRLEGKVAEAEPLLREAVRKLRDREGDLHPDTLNACIVLGLMLYDRDTPGDQAEAEALFREALEGRRRLLGPSHRLTLEAQSNVARAWLREGRVHEAEPLIRDAIVGLERIGAGQEPLAYMARIDLAHCLMRLSRFPEAEGILLDTSKALGPGHGGGAGDDPCAPEFAELYKQWDRAEPGKGYDLKAADWRKRASPQ